MDGGDLLPEPPAAALDFPVAVPADLPLVDVGVVGRGWGRAGGSGAPVLWGNVEVADRSSLVGEDPRTWQLETRPRRGVRPAGPAGQLGLGLLVDPDVATLAADAVHRMLSSRIPAGLGGDETQRRMQACWDRSQELRDAFSPLPPPGSPWQRRDVDVDGQRFAWWVHEDELGWAGAADLGAVFVVGHGLGAAPADRSLRLLAPPQAAQLLAED